MITRIKFGLIFLFVFSFFSNSVFAESLLPNLPKATKGETCVEPLDVMRRNHMDLLNHQRDETVHKGIRGAKHSLIGCVDCHAQQDGQGGFVSVNAEGQFCEACHTFASVKIDCFECHAAKPDSIALSEQTNDQISMWSSLQDFLMHDPGTVSSP